MQQQDKGWCVSRPRGADHLDAGSIPPPSAALKLAAAIVLAAIFPIGLYASSVQPAASGRANASSSPVPANPADKAVSPAVATAALNTEFFDFGNDLIKIRRVQTVAVVTNTGKTTLTMNPTLSGDPSYSIAFDKSCGAQLAAGKSCDMVLRYFPIKASYPKPQNATLNMNFGNAAPGVPDKVAITAISAALKPGVVTPTNNPQVALYTMTLPFPGEMKVQFGPTKSYGLETWNRSTDTNNSQVSVFVAGMKASSTYHMAARVELSNGVQKSDVDHTFKTGALPASMRLNVTTTTTPGMKPQPGIEFTNPLPGLAAIDLEGNIIWTYPEVDANVDSLDGAKLLPNGDILLVMAPLSNAPLAGPIPNDTVVEIREINLAGDTVKEISIADLNAELSTATCAECGGLTLGTFHHDVTPLPNGHWLVLSNMLRTLSPTTNPPLTSKPPQPVLGDVILDLDENLQPVWVWNEFNHLEPNRHPWNFPDWTHTNAILYSPDDHNIIVSIRHQNWVLKVNYDDGQGNGDILWRMGEGGTLSLVGGTYPVDWQYAQHGPAFFSTNTSGVFSLGVMDNGDDRYYTPGGKCGPNNQLSQACLYSTIPIYRIDEHAQTATLVFHQILPGNLYSNFGGNVRWLANGDVEYDLCGLAPFDSLVREVTMEANPKTVWSMSLTGQYFYRAFRVPSLYPGVRW